MKTRYLFVAALCVLFAFTIVYAETGTSSTPVAAQSVSTTKVVKKLAPVTPALENIPSSIGPAPAVQDAVRPIPVEYNGYVINGAPSNTPPPAAPVDNWQREPSPLSELDEIVYLNFDGILCPTLFNQTVAASNEFLADGVQFIGPGGNDGGAFLDASTFGITGHSLPNALCFNTGATLMDGGTPQGPETVSFTQPVSSVEIYAGHSSAGTIYLDAYDIWGTWLGWTSVVGTANLQLMTFTGPDIDYIILSFTGNVACFDDLTFETGVVAENHVALIKDETSFWGNSNEAIMNLLPDVSFDTITSTNLAATDLSGYDAVIVEGCQPQTFYNNIAGAGMDNLEDYVDDGGWLQFNGGTNAHAPQWELFDGTGYIWDDNDNDNWIVPGAEDHWAVQGLQEPFEGNGANHGYLTGYPMGATEIVETTAGNPTLVEYDYGAGKVLVSTMTLEFVYNFGYNAGAILENLIYRVTHRGPGYLVLNTITIDNSVALALDNLGVTYTPVNTADWDNEYMGGYTGVMVAMDGGLPDAADMQAIVDYCDGGGKLMMIGGSNWTDWYTGMSGLVSHTGTTGWVQSSTPHFTVTDAGHPLAAGLPNTHNFATNSASYYCIRINDLGASVAAENGDDWPCLLSKDVGFGTFQYFINSAHTNYWNDADDHDILQTIIENMLGPGGPGAPLTLSATPWVVPTWVGPGGGSFRWDALITNVSPNVMVFDGWTEVMLPNGTLYGPLALYTGLTLAPGGVIFASPLQSVPGYAPGGFYDYIAHVGYYPVPIATDAFPFAKLPIPPGPAAVGDMGDMGDWALSGWFDAEEPAFGSALLPTEYAIEEVYPNPFNPTTNISISLPEASVLTVAIYNTLGQQVTLLANGRYEAGYHNLTFDAHNLSSGIYFVHANVSGKLDQTSKVILMR